MRKLFYYGFGAVLSAVTLSGTFGAQAVPLKQATPSNVTTAASELEQTWPLMFEQNIGQANPEARFISRGTGDQVFLTSNEAVVVLDHGPATDPSRESAVLRFQFIGSRSDTKVEGIEPLDLVTNYFVGEPGSHVSNVANYRKVRYREIYSGIDLVYYRNGRELEFDLIVAPGAHPEQAAFKLAGDVKLQLRDGELHLNTAAGKLVYKRPVAYQIIDGKRINVEAKYKVSSEGAVGFKVGKYDRRQSLVIDPILSYSSLLYGYSAKGVALDSTGAAYVVGSTNIADIPAVGGYKTTLNGNYDAYVVKVDPSGTKLVYASYLGVRRANTSGNGVAVDGSGNVYVIGQTDSTSFPVTTGAFQTTSSIGGGFVTKLNAAGNALVYSTYLNGATPTAIRVDAGGNAYLIGSSTGLAATPGAFQSLGNIGIPPFVAKLNAAGSAMAYVTYFSGHGPDDLNGLAIDQAGNAYLAGTARSYDFPIVNAFQSICRGESDAFLAKLNPTGTGLLYSTCIGGTDKEMGYAVTVDGLGQAYVAGTTYSNDFPVTSNAFQYRKAYNDPSVSNAFVAKFSSDGQSLAYASYLGGRWCLTSGVYSCVSIGSDGIDVATAIAVDAAGFAYLGGFATSAEFPLVDQVQAVGKGGDEYRAPFVAKIMPSGDRLVYSVVLGARAQDERLNGLAVDAQGSVYAVGDNGWADSDFPVTATPLKATGGTFIFKLSTGKYPTTLQSAPNPATHSQPITLAATVLNSTPGGNVTFSDGASSLGSAPVSQGVATLTVSLAPGVHQLTARYSIDGKTSPVLLQTVNPD